MISIGLKIEGLERFKDALNKAPYLVVDEVSKAIQKSLITISTTAKREAPVNKETGGGNLRQKISAVPKMETRLRGKIISEATYSGFVEFGTKAHIIRVKNKKILANKRAGKFFGEKVNHPGTKPNPFMERAINKSQSKIDSFFSKALENIIKSFT
jgi:HK97 gp10 family phage protein